jgi:putative intracellular protease/amidase
VQIAILIFDSLTALDAIGPYEVLSRVPGAEVRFVAKEAGPLRTDTGALGLHADLALGELTTPEVVLVPGGAGSRPLMRDREVLQWLRTTHRGSTWTTSVCTGGLVLGAESSTASEPPPTGPIWTASRSSAPSRSRSGWSRTAR